MVGTARTDTVLVDNELNGEVARSFTFTALSGSMVSVETAVDVKLVSWSSSVRFVLNGDEYGFQAGPQGFGSGAVLAIPGFEFSGELAVAGGLLHLGEVPADLLAGLEPDERQQVEALSDLTAEDREYFQSRTSDAAASSSWIGYWTNEDFDLLLFGSDWSHAEDESLYQLSAFTIDSTDTGIAVRPNGTSSHLSIFGARVSTLLPPIGGLDILPRNDAAGLVPEGQPSLPLTYGGLRRVVAGVATETDTPSAPAEEILVYTNRFVVGLIRDPRFDDLDQPERLTAIQDLNVQWH